MMSKKEYEMYERALTTGQMFEKGYFKLIENLKQLCSYLELRKEQLQYSESKEEIDFVITVLYRAIKSDIYTLNK